MNLLIVMVSNPFNPQSGSENIAFNNIIHLSENHHLDVITLDITNKKAGYDSKNIRLITVQEKKNLSRWLRRLIGRIHVSTSLTDFLSFEMRRAVGNRIEQKTYDAVLLYELGAMSYCSKSLYKKIILNIEDPQSIKMKRLAALPVWKRKEKVILHIRSWLEGVYERYILPKAGKVLLISKADLDDLKQAGVRANFGLITYGTACLNEADVIPAEKRTPGMIVFSGNMFHAPNVDGALFFLQHVYPAVLEAYPQATLWIVGSNPDKRISAAGARFGERVVITGRVDDVSRYLRTAMVSVCPVRLKIGVQTKILEALSCGTPVVTTSAGNSGIGGFSGTNLWVEDEPARFAERVVALLKGDSWASLSAQGRKTVADNFTWEKSASDLEQYIKEVFNRNHLTSQ